MPVSLSQRTYSEGRAFLPMDLSARKRSAKPSLTSCRDDLPAAPEPQRSRRGAAGAYRAGAELGAIADLHRRDQRRVGGDAGSCADVGAMFGHAVIVAGDGAGADVRPRAHPGVADI